MGFGTAAPSDYVPRVEYEVASSPVERNVRPTVARFVADEGYFRTLGIGVVAGREFDASDRPSSVPVAIVNERFASLHWPSQSPVGQRLRLFLGGSAGAWVTVVGVVGNVVQNDRNRQAFEPCVYLPFSQNPQANMFALARTRVRPETLAAQFRRAVYALDRSLPVPALWSLDERFERSYAFERGLTRLFFSFAAISLLLACIGLYASVSRAVTNRTQEIGVRAALGATARDIRRLVLTTAAAPVGFGLVSGLAIAAMLDPLLTPELVQVSPLDPTTLVAVICVLLVAATLGCLIPMRRALGVDPVVALRHE